MDDSERKLEKKRRKEEKRRLREAAEAESKVVDKTVDKILSAVEIKGEGKAEGAPETNENSLKRKQAPKSGANKSPKLQKESVAGDSPSSTVSGLTDAQSGDEVAVLPEQIVVDPITAMYDFQYKAVCNQIRALEDFRTSLSTFASSDTVAACNKTMKGKRTGSSTVDPNKKRRMPPLSFFWRDRCPGMKLKDVAELWRALSAEERLEFGEKAKNYDFGVQV